jgi:hypothetical protein
MINIEFDEKSIFTYDHENLAIGVWDHRDGEYKGPVIGHIGSIKFANRKQVYHFMEMLEFILERVDASKIKKAA